MSILTTITINALTIYSVILVPSELAQAVTQPLVIVLDSTQGLGQTAIINGVLELGRANHLPSWTSGN